MTSAVRRTGATLTGIGIGVALDGLGAFDGSPAITTAIGGGALIAVGVTGVVWAVRRRWGAR
jgi:uncharacterized protein (TIGR03382 family)